MLHVHSRGSRARPTSHFSELPESVKPVPISDQEVANARSASHGAVGFMASVQFVAWVIFATSPLHDARDHSGTVILAVCYNIMHAFVWRSDPGFLCEEVPSTEPQIPIHDEDEVPLRWCQDCCIWQPLRTKHCEKCGFCVRRFDHHCFWIGGCIGERNHVRFFGLLVLATCYISSSLLVLPGLLAWDGSDETTLMQNVRTNITVIFILCCAVGMWFFVVSLWIFHCFLVLTGQTTWEVLSGNRITYLRYAASRPAFSRGIFHNVMEFWKPPEEHRILTVRLNESRMKYVA